MKKVMIICGIYPARRIIVVYYSRRQIISARLRSHINNT